MSFDVPAAAYRRFMGRYSEPLADVFADWCGVRRGQRVVDVGCGPGALTARLVDRCGPDAVAAIDPSEPFVVAARERFPGVDVRLGAAEDLPFDDGTFDAALAQLVVQFMTDPVAGLREMGRVSRGGVVAACVWDHGGRGGPLALFWRAARELDPAAPGEADRPGSREGHLAELAAKAGLSDIESSALTVSLPFETVDDWWAPYLLGVGPAGEYVAAQDDDARAALRDRCAELLPDPPFTHDATAWCVRARSRG